MQKKYDGDINRFVVISSSTLEVNTQCIWLIVLVDMTDSLHHAMQWFCENDPEIGRREGRPSR